LVEDARAWTADLAHGLKTPLTALGADAQRLRARGETGMAEDLEQLAQSMRRRVDRELIRARLRSEASGRAQHADLLKIARGVVATLKRTPSGESLAWEIEASGPAQVRLSPDDLAELLGNLLDNAGKWARARVRIVLSRHHGWRLTIEDDGPGVPEEQRTRLGQRGVRLDEQTAGTGLGLAIARDIVAAYDGQLKFGLSRLGGLEVRLDLPAALAD
jgi:signal transduction histidine kinase